MRNLVKLEISETLILLYLIFGHILGHLLLFHVFISLKYVLS